MYISKSVTNVKSSVKISSDRKLGGSSGEYEGKMMVLYNIYLQGGPRANPSKWSEMGSILNGTK